MSDNQSTAAELPQDENSIIAERRAKLTAIRAKGIAFPNDFKPQHKSATLQEQYGDKSREELEELNVEVVIAGRMMLKREAGKKAAQMAEQAKKQQLSNLGRIELHPTFPKRVPAGKTFDVPAKMDPAFSAILSKVAISVTDQLSDKTYTSDQPAGAEMSFMVPAKLVTGEASLSVKLVGLDGRDNELVTAQSRVAVDGKALGGSGRGTGGASGPAPDKGPPKKFWQTPWPYVLGGVALAAGGGALYYFVLRPADAVQVREVRVE